MTGKQFIKLQQLGQAAYTKQQVESKKKELFAQYPFFAKLDVKDGSIIVRAGRFDGRYNCMKCGVGMNNRAGQYLKDGAWIKKSRNDKISNWECVSCYPSGGAPLMIGCCVIE